MNLPEIIIVGAGPAGLTAAIYLGRFHRTVLLIDAGDSRAHWIPKSHNIPGFTQGIAGTELLAQLRQQALRYGAEFRREEVRCITRDEENFIVYTSGPQFRSRYMILATGVKDRLPQLAGAEEAVLRSLLRICPVCDAFEATGQSIGVISDGEHGEREAEFLRHYSDKVTLIHVGTERHAVGHDRLRNQGIQIVRSPLKNLEIRSNSVTLHPPGEAPRSFDVCYTALGCAPRNHLAAELGARLDDTGALIVNRHQETSVSRLYAAGDVVRGLNQVVVAAAEAAIAGTDIHNQLRRLGV